MPTANQSAAQIADLTGVERHDVAVVLGSGWAAVVETFEPRSRIPYTDIAGLHAPGVAGHAGHLSSAECGDHQVLIFSGRTHLYEGGGAETATHAIRAAAAAGCRAVVLTNGAGSLHTQWPPGTPVLIRDHVNLTGASPLTGPEFIDMTDAYSPRLRTIARRVSPEIPEGVYAQFPGPQFETPAEVRMAAAMGADLVGMSAALETIAARAAGMEVLGLSVVTNLAAGLSPEAIDHDALLATVARSGPKLAELVTGILEEM